MDLVGCLFHFLMIYSSVPDTTSLTCTKVAKTLQFLQKNKLCKMDLVAHFTLPIIFSVCRTPHLLLKTSNVAFKENTQNTLAQGEIIEPFHIFSPKGARVQIFLEFLSQYKMLREASNESTVQ